MPRKRENSKSNRKGDQIGEEESKEYTQRRKEVQQTGFNDGGQGSDDEAYADSSEDADKGSLRDDLSFSDDADELEEEILEDVDEDLEERERAFFGDDDYTLLSRVPEEEDEEPEEIQMSMTMQQREIKEKMGKVSTLEN